MTDFPKSSTALPGPNTLVIDLSEPHAATAAPAFEAGWQKRTFNVSGENVGSGPYGSDPVAHIGPCLS